MTDTIEPTRDTDAVHTAGIAASAGAVPVGSEVRDLDTRQVLAAAATQRRAADAAEAKLLALAVQLVYLHPVTDDTLAASSDPAQRPASGVDPDTGEVIDADGDGCLGGVGTPGVAERAVEELGAALDVPYTAALGLVCDAVELCYRLPRLWTLVQAGRAGCRPGRRAASPRTPPGSPRPRWGSWTGTSRSSG